MFINLSTPLGGMVVEQGNVLELRFQDIGLVSIKLNDNIIVLNDCGTTGWFTFTTVITVPVVFLFYCCFHRNNEVGLGR